MTAINFQFFALRYLNDWIESDQRFVQDLSAGLDPHLRLKTLCDAAQYYGIIRNFGGTRFNEEKLAGSKLAAALSALDAIVAPTVPDEADDAVRHLVYALKSIYNKNLVSAASKFLWLRFQWPVVIYDGQAAQSLRACGSISRSADYSEFRQAWHNEFNKHQAKIHIACISLSIAKPFSLGRDMPMAEFDKLITLPWFHERVFDKYLWWRSSLQL